MRRTGRAEQFLSNLEKLWPDEIAACLGVRLLGDGSVEDKDERRRRALVGGCVLVAVVLDLASSSAKGLKWNETSGKKRSNAMREFVKDYMPSAYRSTNWYSQFRSPLVHNFCPSGLELTHAAKLRQRHLKKLKVSVDGIRKDRQCVHVFQLFEDVTRGLRCFVADARADKALYQRVKRYASHYGALEIHEVDC